MPHNETMNHAKKIAGIVMICLLMAGTAQPKRADGLFIIAHHILLAVLIWDHNSCWLNWFWGCDGDGGGAGPVPGDGCVSQPNICGGRRAGVIQGDGTCSAPPAQDSECEACESGPNSCGMRGSGYLVDGTCDAVVPSEDLCPPTVDAGGDLKALPSRFIDAVGDTVMLTWSIGHSTDCSVSINGESQTVPTTTLAAAYTTPPLMRPANDVTLRCYNSVPTNSASWTIRVMVNPNAVEF
jgi:hypothetical protein